VRQWKSFRQVRSSGRSRAEANRAGRQGTEAHPGLPVIVGFGRDSGGRFGLSVRFGSNEVGPRYDFSKHFRFE
jgi:hypothetical protein